MDPDPFALPGLDPAAFPPGMVWLVGAGPGDPGLMTLHGLAALRQADVIVYDALVDPRILAWRRAGAVAEHAGKRGGKPSPSQRDISLRLVELARAGKRVLRLKGGDPFVFGRGGEEALALVRAGVPFRVTPGITAGIGGLAQAGIPVTHRDVNQAVTFVTGHDQSGEAPSAIDWAAIARGAPVIVLYMAMKHLDRIAASLIAGGRPPSDPVAIVQDATLPAMRVLETTLAEAAAAAAAAGMGAPAIVCVGRNVLLRQAIDWAGQLEGAAPRALDPLGQPGCRRQRMTVRGLAIAAPASGSGKTTVTLGLLRALRNRGLAVAGAKSGPDYIDPAFHAAACGRPSVNLDAWAMPPDRLRALAAGQGAELLVVEGAMGVLDAAADGRGSAADLAEALGLPVVLVLALDGQGQSAALAPAGLRALRPGLAIAGAILNRAASGRHAALARDALAAAGVPVLGVIPRSPGLALPSRHLGLVLPGELPELEAVLAAAAGAVAVGVDLDALLDAARPLAPARAAAPVLPPLGQRIAVACDAAFAFAYPHLLADWRAAGAEIGFFAPLADEPPPAEADAVFLPGGYPELHAGPLAAATRFAAGMRAAAARGATVYGECGGFMALGEVLTDAGGRDHPMLGLLPVATSFAERRLSLGYRRLAPRPGGPWSQPLAGHEFHYATLTRAGPAEALFDAGDAAGRALAPMGLRRGRVAGSFAHVIGPLDP